MTTRIISWLCVGLLVTSAAIAETWHCISLRALGITVEPSLSMACPSIATTGGGTASQTATLTWQPYDMRTQSSTGSNVTAATSGTSVCTFRFSPSAIWRRDSARVPPTTPAARSTGQPQ